MNTYEFKVEQVIVIKAESLDEARNLLPEYPYSPNPSWVIVDETIENLER